MCMFDQGEKWEHTEERKEALGSAGLLLLWIGPSGSPGEQLFDKFTSLYPTLSVLSVQ